MKKIYSAIQMIVIFMVVCFISTSNVIGQEVVLDVPMIMRGGMPAVEVKVNGKGPFIFGIDTGASGVGRADTTLVEQLKLQPFGQIQAGDGSGKTTTLNTYKFDSVSIGSIDFKNIEVLSRNYNVRPDIPKIDGIIGFNLLKDYLLVLDYPAKRVRLEKGELPKADGEKILDFEDPRGIPVIELKIGNTRIKAHIDSGNMVGGFVLPASVVEKLPLASEPTVVGRARTVSGEMEIKQVNLKDGIYFGSNLYAAPTVVYPAINEYGNVGAKVLADYVLTFDQKNKRLKLQKSASPKENSVSKTIDCNKYAGEYENRKVTCEDGQLFIQRIISEKDQNSTGPKMVAPKLKLIPVGNDEFKLEQIPNARIKFVKNTSGEIIEMHVLNPQGVWEKSKRKN